MKRRCRRGPSTAFGLSGPKRAVSDHSTDPSIRINRSFMLRTTATLTLRRGSRRLCQGTTPPPSLPIPAVFASGLAGGSLGGLVGLGGGAIVVPALTAYARLTQHMAVGTSSAAMAAVGIAGMASFGSAGAVDLVAAAAVALTAMGGARVGAKLTSRFNAVQLQARQLVARPFRTGLVRRSPARVCRRSAPSRSSRWSWRRWCRSRATW